MSLSRMQRAANFPPTLAWSTSTIFGVFKFTKVKSDARAVHDALGFQLQLDGCMHDVMTDANVSTWERPCLLC